MHTKSDSTGFVLDYRVIPLTKGKVSVVDTQDYDYLSRFKWRFQAKANIRRDTGSAITTVSVGGKRRTVFMHRLILNPPHGVEVDHRDRDGLNNRRQNLRLATRTQNMANTAGYPSYRKYSKYKGVEFYPARCTWRARLGRTYLGFFNSEEDAARAFDFAAIGKHGEFAYTNFEDSRDLFNRQAYIPVRRYRGTHKVRTGFV